MVRIFQLKLATRNLARHHTRTIISLSAIAFGVIALLIAGGFIEWIFWAIREAAILNGLGHVQITRPGFRAVGFADPNAFLLPPTSAELDIVRRAPYVEVVDQQLVLPARRSSRKRTKKSSGYWYQLKAKIFPTPLQMVYSSAADWRRRSVSSKGTP